MKKIKQIYHKITCLILFSGILSFSTVYAQVQPLYSLHSEIPGDVYIVTNPVEYVNDKLNKLVTNNQPMNLTFTNNTTLASGQLNGTNGVFFTINGTNYWILLQ